MTVAFLRCRIPAGRSPTQAGDGGLGQVLLAGGRGEELRGLGWSCRKCGLGGCRGAAAGPGRSGTQSRPRTSSALHARAPHCVFLRVKAAFFSSITWLLLAGNEGVREFSGGPGASTMGCCSHLFQKIKEGSRKTFRVLFLPTVLFGWYLSFCLISWYRDPL